MQCGQYGQIEPGLESQLITINLIWYISRACNFTVMIAQSHELSSIIDKVYSLLHVFQHVALYSSDQFEIYFHADFVRKEFEFQSERSQQNGAGQEFHVFSNEIIFDSSLNVRWYIQNNHFFHLCREFNLVHTT